MNPNEKTEYTPISCNFYDLIEHHAIRKNVVTIVYMQGDTTHEIQSRILDTRTRKTGEFVLLEKEGLEIRMDDLRSIDGEELGNYC